MADQNVMQETLQDFFIAHLLLSGVSQRAVQKVVKVDIVKVNRIGKLLKGKKGARTLDEG